MAKHSEEQLRHAEEPLRHAEKLLRNPKEHSKHPGSLLTTRSYAAHPKPGI